MTVKELKEELNNYPQDALIMVYDPEVGEAIEATGFLLDPTNNTLEIHSDDPT